MLVRNCEQSKLSKKPYHLQKYAIIYGAVTAIFLLFNFGLLYTFCFFTRGTPLRNSEHLHSFIWVQQLFCWNIGLQKFVPTLRNFLNILNLCVLLPFLTSLYVFDEISMYPFLSMLPCYLTLIAHDFLRGALRFETYKTRGYSNFITIIGRHDALFLYTLVAMFIFVYNLIDTFTQAYEIGFNLWFLFFSFYCVNLAIDEKIKETYALQIKSRIATLSYITIFVFT